MNTTKHQNFTDILENLWTFELMKMYNLNKQEQVRHSNTFYRQSF